MPGGTAEQLAKEQARAHFKRERAMKDALDRDLERVRTGLSQDEFDVAKALGMTAAEVTSTEITLNIPRTTRQWKIPEGTLPLTDLVFGRNPTTLCCLKALGSCGTSRPSPWSSASGCGAFLTVSFA